MREVDGPGLDAIVVTASGCGTTVKDYGFMFRDDAAYAAKAARVSRARQRHHRADLDEIGLRRRRRRCGCASPTMPPARCSTASRSVEPPKALLRARRLRGGRAAPKAHLCCGSAGTYNILQPEIAGRLRDRKVATLERDQAPQVIATGNIGCMTQIGAGTAVPVVHTVELLDWATGGPRPPALGPA